MLVVRAIRMINEVGGSYPEGQVLLSDTCGAMLWTLGHGRTVVEARSLHDYQTVPLNTAHVDVLLAGGAIDWRLARMLYALLVR